MIRLPPISLTVPGEETSVTVTWQPPDVPADATTDDLAEVHANFRGWMNQQYQGAGKFWQYDPAFSSSGVKCLLRLAWVASLYTDELRFGHGNLYIPADVPSRDRIVLEAAKPLTSPRTIARLSQTLADGSALLIQEREGEIICDGLFYSHDSRIVSERLMPPREWIEHRDGILVTILGPGHLRLRQGPFDYTLEKDTLVCRRAVTAVPLVTRWLRKTHEFLLRHHPGGQVDWSCLFNDGDATWVEVFLIRVLRAAFNAGHGGTLVVLSEPDAAPVQLTYRARADSPLEGLSKLHGAWARAWSKTVDSGGAEALISFEKRLNVVLSQADALGRLTATDGCVVLDQSMRLRGFGGIINTDRARLESSLPLMDQVANVSMSRQEESEFFQRFGTRHRSAGELCKACPNTIAFVLSQDGDLRVFCSDDKQVFFFDRLSAR
jgi:hypothetical protein